jgi:pyruvate dehydrogenase E2 component (dihydrolipoamide acetyltransferase)
MSTRQVVVPDIGNFKDVSVIEVHVKPGDRVAADAPLLTLETDKATIDVPAPFAGTVAEMHVATGAKVSQGSLILTMEAEEGAAAAPPPAAASVAAAAPKSGVASASAPVSRPVEVPDIGNFKDVPVIEVHVKSGDVVAADAPLLTLETEKATIDVPAPFAGTVTAVHVGAGDKVSAGSLVATLDVIASAAPAVAPSAPAKTASAAAPSAPPRAVKAAPVAAPAAAVRKPAALPPVNEAGFAKAHASPSVRQFARELGVDLASVRGSGARGRITVDDVKSFVKSVMSGAQAAGPSLPQVPVVDFAQFGAVQIKPLSRVQKISGPRLHASWVNLPHVTQFDQADITALEDQRRALKARAAAEGVKLTPLAFVLRACALTLRQFPTFNASLDAAGENLVLKQYCHLGFAADTPNGLMVPVIRDADRKDVFELARALAELSEKARNGRLSGADMQGGCFTVSSLGGIGGTAFTPIINAPEVAILGVSRSSLQPVYQDGAFVPRMMLPLSLSYDHRVIDGAEGARFITALSQSLANVSALLEPVV